MGIWNINGSMMEMGRIKLTHDYFSLIFKSSYQIDLEFIWITG